MNLRNASRGPRDGVLPGAVDAHVQALPHHFKALIVVPAGLARRIDAAQAPLIQTQANKNGIDIVFLFFFYYYYYLMIQLFLI